MHRVLVPITIAYLAYGLALAGLSHAGLEMRSGLLFPYLAERPVGEDGYYMLTVAWNIASGQGVVYNYGMDTTGIQPLSTAIYAALAWIVQLVGGDKWLFVRSVLLFGSATLLLFAHTIGSLARDLADQGVRDLTYALGFIATVFNFTLFRSFTYGLETGVYLILFALCLRYSLTLPGRRPGTREAIVMGLLAGITAWARIDFGVMLGVFLTLSLLERKLTTRWIVLTGVVAALIISPWFLYTFRVTGSWLPSSGGAQAGTITMQVACSRLWIMGKAILSHSTPWIYSTPGGALSLVALLSLLLFVGFLFGGRPHLARVLPRFRQGWPLSNWLIAIAVLIFVYLVSFSARHFYHRYSIPLVVPLTAIMAVLLANRIQEISRTAQTVLIYSIPLCFFGWAALSLHAGRITSSHAISAAFIQRNFSSAKVGAFQSGIIGYYNSNVVNLDGKLDHKALDYLKRDELHLYIDAERIDVLVDWPNIIYSHLEPDWLAANWEMCQRQVPGGASICLQRRSYAATGTSLPGREHPHEAAAQGAQ